MTVLSINYSRIRTSSVKVISYNATLDEIVKMALIYLYQWIILTYLITFSERQCLVMNHLSYLTMFYSCLILI